MRGHEDGTTGMVLGLDYDGICRREGLGIKGYRIVFSVRVRPICG
jgi:hypothetical protein